MNAYFGFNLALVQGSVTSILATALALTSAQTVLAAATQITAVDVQSTENGVELILKTDQGDRPQVFSSSRNDKWVADLINTQLDLASGMQFQQVQPAPGIAEIAVVPLDSNSIRITVTGTGGAPTGQLTNRDVQGLAFDITSGSSSNVVSTSASPSTLDNSNSDIIAQSNSEPSPDVLFPNPEIIITDTDQPVAIPRNNPVPTPLPRAIAPPLGDVAISELGVGSRDLKLGTLQRVPRLVLRDAPAREVLALLARAASLNLAFIGGEEGGEGPSITLDIEDEAVQDVFNYVLRLTELDAVLNGRTVLVGPELPPEVESANTTIRTLRVNQAEVESVANYLSAQGAEARLVETVTTRTIEGEGTVNQQVREETTTQVTTVSPEESETGAPSVLTGLTVVTDSRLNSITLVGEPSIISLATSFIKQLDLRQRQAAVNVKIVDVDLDNTAGFSSSFSFGINDTFVVSDGGNAAINFGDFAPADSTTTGDLSPGLIANPGAVLQLSQPTGGVIIDGVVFEPSFEANVTEDPFDVRITDIDNDTGAITQSLANFIQYPTRFLASLSAQIISNDAKILTDPTLVIQEGQTAAVNITDRIVTDVTETVTAVGDSSQITRNFVFEEVGLVLSISLDRIDDNGFLTMEVQPRITSPGATIQLTLSDGSPQDVSQVVEQELSTGKIRLRDGQTLILAGVIQETDTEFVTKWPLLGDLPIVGSLFRGTTSTRDRGEIVIVVTPQIMDDSDTSNFGYNYIPSPEVQELLED